MVIKASQPIWLAFIFLSLLCGVVLVSFLGGQLKEGQKDVPYVPSRSRVIKAMLELSEVKEDDLVYDLGCGDGRIVIAAAQQYGARGIGVDVDPELIEQSIKNARHAGVADLVEFRLQDLFQADISQATVVTLYLGTDANLRLRPKLLKELRPGSRVISNSFLLGDWQPDRSVEVPSITLSFMVYCWIVPTDVEGVWLWNTSICGEERHYALQLEQRFQQIRGKVHNGFEELPITAAYLSGDQISFVFADTIARQTTTLRFNGWIRGETISGSVQIQTETSTSSQTWSARRSPHSVQHKQQNHIPLQNHQISL